MNVISSENRINSSMHLNAANLSAINIMLIIYPVDVIILNNTENTAEVTYDTCLSAVMDLTSSDNM